MGRDYSPFQRKVIRRYYDNLDAIRSQRLAEVVTEIYLAQGGKKAERLWARAEKLLLEGEVPAEERAVLERVMHERDIEALAEIAGQRF